MLIEQGTVLHYDQGRAVIQCNIKSSCGACRAKRNCGIKTLSGLTGEKSAPQLELYVNQTLQIGDIIQIGLEEEMLLRSVFFLYCIPLIVIVLSAVIFSLFFTNELLIALSIFINTGISFMVIKWWLGEKQHSKPKVVFLGKI